MGIEGGVAVPLGLCVMSWLGWAALVVTRSLCAHAALALLRECARERGMLLLCQLILVVLEKGGTGALHWMGRTESGVRKAPSWYWPGIVCIGHLGAKIHGGNGFHFYTVVEYCIL